MASRDDAPDLVIPDGPVSEPPVIVTVVPDVTGLDRVFDYVVPVHLLGVIGVGSRVRIPLHGRRVGGWVVALGSSTEVTGTLKNLAKSSGLGPDATLLDLAGWAARRWGAGRLRPFLVAASPDTVVNRAATPRRTVVRAEPSSPAATKLLADGGGVLRLPPSADHLPAVLSAARLGPTLVVTPSAEGASLLAQRLRRAGVSVASVPDEWAAARGGVDVVIGARRAAWAPCPDMAAAVVLDEHDESLQEERSPTWHAREVVAERARRMGAPLLLVSPCPSAVGSRGRVVVAPPHDRERAGWPVVGIIDRSAVEPWRRSLLSSELIAELRDHSRRVVCVINTTGHARLLACRACRGIVRCAGCGAAAAEAAEGVLSCASCGQSRARLCDSCGSTNLARVRPGTARLRLEIEQAAHREALEMSGAAKDVLDDGRVDVFVGTEAVLHRVRRADSVWFLDFDAELLAPRYRAHEQAVSLVARAARLVGAGRDGGRVFLQTSVPDHPVVTDLVGVDLSGIGRREDERRREASLPPYAALALLEGEGAEALAVSLGFPVARWGDGWLVRAPDSESLGDALVATPRDPAARIRVVVDPQRV